MIHDTGLFLVYNAIIGLLAVAGLIHLIVRTEFITTYESFVHLLVAGLVLFAGIGPLVDLILPRLSHVVHGLAAILVILGLYNPVHRKLRREEWEVLLVREPSEMRHPSEWMVPMDDDILELFGTSDLVLTPAIIAYNAGYSREEVNRRLTELSDHGFVERVGRGKYRITDFGKTYLVGEPVDTGTHPAAVSASH